MMGSGSRGRKGAVLRPHGTDEISALHFNFSSISTTRAVWDLVQNIRLGLMMVSNDNERKANDKYCLKSVTISMLRLNQFSLSVLRKWRNGRHILLFLT
jgi:hypothetical protein